MVRRMSERDEVGDPWRGRFLSGLVAELGIACGGVQAASTDPGAADAVGQVLDDWHAAAAASDEARYFGHFTADAVFLGTDATERWSRSEFRAYAHPHFEASRGWAFRSVRRDVVLGGSVTEGALAWFDEDLATENLGPARGSGVMRFEAGRWRIVHYNLTITVPNERFGAVRALLASDAEPTPAQPTTPTDGPESAVEEH